MMHLYPGNRMEDLVVLLGRLLAHPVGPVLAEEQIVVQNLGMHHWLCLEMAVQSGIAMNLRFPLPGNYIWKTISTLLGENRVPEASPFSIEILIWKIYQVLGKEEVLEDPLYKEPVNYWYHEKNKKGDFLKRFQLARELARQFEQYLIYRPEWISEWDKTEPPLWQGRLWKLICKNLPNHPLKLLDQAINILPENYSQLPERSFLFGLNSLPPIWISFLNKLAQYRDLHFFVFNPSDEYWGDIQNEKVLARQRVLWLKKGQDPKEMYPNTGNPLLASFGQQGQEFINQLCETGGEEISLFYSPGRGSLLHCLQDDLLKLRDARKQSKKKVDNSLVITSTHSALREVQALHDWLLRIFEKDSSLTPKDILVMCPEIENYSPYVDAVFSRSGDNDPTTSTRLPCSIADRRLTDAEPMVQAFLELLQLPDSRFQVSQILSYLRLTAIQKRFGLDDNDVETFTVWLSRAAIHWGLDGTHKSRIIGIDPNQSVEANERFTWAQGLRRLLLGFAYSDEDSIFTGADELEQLLIPCVDEGQALTLGKLLVLLERLQNFVKELSQSKDPLAWQSCLRQMVSDLFETEPEDKRAEQLIIASISALSENCDLADYREELPLIVVRDFLNQQFAQPEQGHHFMTGQVTFCSLVPMRSVPFKVIAMLGLNDGEFPRQSNKPGFDLMDKNPSKIGDRSRRGDDRTLFLEAIISARKHLYLSYQGQDLKNNNPRQPSLVLRELTDYLEQGYAWNQEDIRHIPLQPFCVRNFISPNYSYDSRWLALSTPQPRRENRIELPPLEVSEEVVPLETLVDFFVSPVKLFAQTRLSLRLEEAENLIEDTEPFTTNHLDRYKVQERLVAPLVKGESVASILLSTQLRGHLPDTPQLQADLIDWQEQAQDFARRVRQEKGHEVEQKELGLSIEGYKLSASLPLCHLDDGEEGPSDSLLFWRLADPKAKDLVRMWLHHLVANLSGTSSVSTRGIFRVPKKSQFKVLAIAPFEKSKEELTKWINTWQKGLCKPTLINADLALKYFEKVLHNKAFTEGDFLKLWLVNYQNRGLASDPYINWFWQEMPIWRELKGPLEELYHNMFLSIQEIKE